MSRPLVLVKNFENILEFAKEEWKKELLNKGTGIFVSSHEILGCLVEETREFEEAIQKNDLNKLKDELADILVVALHGLASIATGKMDWPKENNNNYCRCSLPREIEPLSSQSSNFVDTYICSACGKLVDKSEIKDEKIIK